MPESTHTMTQKGLDELKVELDHRINVKREELRSIVEDSIQKGDISENEAYELALEETESNEMRIAELERVIGNAVIATDTGIHTVSIGNTVSVRSSSGDLEIQIVGQAEANPLDNKISDATPLGQALIGKKKGDKVTISLPKGDVEYEILNIS